jgi:hypothetical protein
MKGFRARSHGEPGRSRGAEGADPPAIACFGDLESDQPGRVTVGLVPMPDIDWATSTYTDRASALGQREETAATAWVETDRTTLGTPWDDGVLVIGEDANRRGIGIVVLARSGTWLLHLELTNSTAGPRAEPLLRSGYSRWWRTRLSRQIPRASNPPDMMTMTTSTWRAYGGHDVVAESNEKQRYLRSPGLRAQSWRR